MTETSAKKPRQATMRDVAERARVSVQTVSNLVNGRSNLMTAETRERVTQSMVILDYRPNATARGLRSAKTRELGFLLLDDDPQFLADPMTDMVMAGAGDVTRENGYGLLIQSARHGEIDEGLLRPLLESRVDAAILYLSGEPISRDAYMRRVEQLGHPCVVIGEPRGASAPSVTAANFDGAHRLATHLLEKGHRRVAFVAARTSWPMIEERYSGYRAALQQHAIEPARELQLFRGLWDAESGEQMADMLFELRDPPTAIMAANDLLALGVMRSARLRTLRVPEDVAVSGFNDFDFSAFVDPALTTVSIPAYEMGRSAATILIDQLEGRAEARSVAFPVEVLLRDST